MNITQTNNTHTTQNKQHSLTNMDTSTQELVNMLDQMKDKLKKFGMEKVALKKENNKLKAENKELNDKVQEGVSLSAAWSIAQRSMEEMFEEINKLKKENKELNDKVQEKKEKERVPGTGLSRKDTLHLQHLKEQVEHLEKEKEQLIVSNDKLLSTQKKEYELIKGKYHEAVDDLEEAQEFIEQVYDNTGNAHDSNEYLAEHISDLEQFSLAYQEQWDAWTEDYIEGDHWVQKSQVVPEHIKKEWKNVWYCLADEEQNCYNQEGHDPEVKTSELEDGWTYKSMRVIDDWVKSSE